MITDSPSIESPTGADGLASRPGKGYRRLRLLLISLDVLGGTAAWSAVLLLSGYRPWHSPLRDALATAVTFTVFTILLVAMHHLYLARVCAVRSVEFSRLASSCLVCALAGGWLNQTHHIGPSPTLDVLGAATSLALIAILRRGYSSWLRSRRSRGDFCRPVCILGANEEAELLIDLFEGQPELGYRVVAVLGDPALWAGRTTSVPAIGWTDDPAQAARSTGATGVILTASSVAPHAMDQVVRRLVSQGLHVHLSTGLSRIGHHRIRANPFCHQMLLYVEHSGLSWWQSTLKRGIDVVVSSLALLCSLPLLLLAALAIKAEDGGPILYRQNRVGRSNEPFQVIKLRTMVPDAGARLAELAKMNERSGPLFKLSVDPRVTRVGRILRATSIDELPQLFNVLKGEMSLVGPRPALPSEVAQFDAELLERSTVPPGITGLWQVEARDNPSFRAYRRLDLFYVDNWSLMLDVTILAATCGVVVAHALRALRRGGEMLRGSRETQPVAMIAPKAAVSPLVAAQETTAVGG